MGTVSRVDLVANCNNLIDDLTEPDALLTADDRIIDEPVALVNAYPVELLARIQQSLKNLPAAHRRVHTLVARKGLLRSRLIRHTLRLPDAALVVEHA